MLYEPAGVAPAMLAMYEVVKVLLLVAAEAVAIDTGVVTEAVSKA